MGADGGSDGVAFHVAVMEDGAGGSEAEIEEDVEEGDGEEEEGAVAQSARDWFGFWFMAVWW